MGRELPDLFFMDAKRPFGLRGRNPVTGCTASTTTVTDGTTQLASGAKSTTITITTVVASKRGFLRTRGKGFLRNLARLAGSRDGKGGGCGCWLL